MNKNAVAALKRIVARLKNRAVSEHGKRWKYVLAEIGDIDMLTFDAITNDNPIPVITLEDLFNLADGMDFELKIIVKDRKRKCH